MTRQVLKFCCVSINVFLLERKLFMKRLLAIALALALVMIMVAACGNDDTTAPDATEPSTDATGNRAVRLASHNAVLEGNPYRVRYEADIQEAAAAASAHGFDVSYASFVSNWDPATEASQIQNSINEGFDIILVNPVASTGLDPIIERAQEAGIIWINADVVYLSTAVEILNIATDQYYLGYRTGTYAGEVLGRGARVVMLQAMPGVSANEDRQAGFQQAILEQGLEVVASESHNWDPALSTQVMTEILNTGVEFDGVLVSQVAENALAAFEITGRPLPRFMGFNDTGAWMQQMIELNRDERVMDFIVLSNPPGVGASALNFGLNMMLGRELRTDIFDDPSIRSILLPSDFSFTYDNMWDYEELAFSMSPGDAYTYWLTVDEVNERFFVQ